MTLWETIVWVYFGFSTLCILIMLDVLINRLPLVTVFLALFGLLYYLNRKWVFKC